MSVRMDSSTSEALRGATLPASGAAPSVPGREYRSTSPLGASFVGMSAARIAAHAGNASSLANFGVLLSRSYRRIEVCRGRRDERLPVSRYGRPTQADAKRASIGGRMARRRRLRLREHVRCRRLTSATSSFDVEAAVRAGYVVGDDEVDPLLAVSDVLDHSRFRLRNRKNTQVPRQRSPGFQDVRRAPNRAHAPSVLPSSVGASCVVATAAAMISVDCSPCHHRAVHFLRAPDADQFADGWFGSGGQSGNQRHERHARSFRGDRETMRPRTGCRCSAPGRVLEGRTGGDDHLPE